MTASFLDDYVHDEMDLQTEIVGEFFQRSVDDLKMLAQQPPIRQGSIPEKISYLREQFGFFLYKFRSFYWDEMTGDVYGMEGIKFSVRDRDFYLKDFRRGKVAITKVIKDKASGTNVMLVLVPVFSNGKQVGGLAATVSIESLLRNALRRPLEYGGTAILIDEDRRFVTKTSSPSSLPSAVIETVSRDLDLSTKSGNIGTARHKVTIGGEGLRIYSRKMSPTNWTLAIIFPEKTLMQPIASMQRSTIIVILMALTLSFFLGVLLRKVILNPIHRLQRAYRAISRGDLSLRESPTSRDELAMLIKSFNQMANNLRAEKEAFAKSEKELSRAIEQAKNASEAKSRFIAIMSHELRTPLQGIIGAAELIELTSDDRDIQQFAEHIQQTAQSLVRHLSKVINLSDSEQAFVAAG